MTVPVIRAKVINHCRHRSAVDYVIMKHQWQLIERVSNLLHRDICNGCCLERKAKNKNGDGFITTYSGGYTAYAHTPDCSAEFPPHEWIFDKDVPWESCSKCGLERLTTVTPGPFGTGNLVWFRVDDTWTNIFHPCR